jgi:probable rRNA maturation factor
LSRAPAPARPNRPKKPTPRRVRIEILVRSGRWRRHPRAGTAVKRAILAAAKASSTPAAELAIVLCNDSAIRALNRDWRGKNTPTNVLSFPAGTPSKSGRGTPYVGDIVIAYETVAREAAAEGKPFEHHLAHLAVHGFLHLLGHDHGKARDAQRMERLERSILAGIGIPDPYAVRAAQA